MATFSTPSDPFSEMRRLQSEMNRLFQSATSRSDGGFPYLNVYANQDGITVTAELPGVSDDDLDITVHRDTLTIRGERPQTAGDEVKGFHRRERRTGRFVRTMALPFAVDPEQVQASMQNGVLRLTLNRPESDKPRRIQVNAS